MKRKCFRYGTGFVLAFLCVCLFPGCSPGKVVEHVIGSGDTRPEPPPTGVPSHKKNRVYMDEVQGRLVFFDGTTLRLKVGEDSYLFDVSHANIECKRGMLTNDDVSVIYEGKLDGTNTRTVSALKVTDAMHKKDRLRENTLTGTLTMISPYAATIQNSEGQTIVCPIIGKPACFLGGLHLGSPVTVHYFGKLPNPSNENASEPGRYLFDVLSISDTDPFTLPSFPEAQITPAEGTAENTVTPIRCTLEQLNGQLIRLHPVGYNSVIEMNLGDYPVYLPSGFLPGTSLAIYAKGSFNGQDLSGLTIQYLQGTDPAGIRTGEVASFVTGVITGTTANTLTIRTQDQVLFTCYTSHVIDESTQERRIGSSIRITLQPADTQGTNIYTVLKFEDAIS